MKRFQIVLLVLVFVAFAGKAQNVGVNDDNSNPNASAILDVFSASKGLLIPRIALLSINDVTTIASPAISLLVYNTSTTTDLTPGYYYWDDASKWVRLNASGDYLKNMYYVGTESRFKTIEEAITFLSVVGNMTGPSVVVLDGGTHVVASTITINLPYPLTIEGTSFGMATINCPDNGNTAFDAQTECYFKMLFFNAGSTAGIAVNLSGAGVNYEVKDANFTGFAKAIVMSSSIIFWLFEVEFVDCTIAGVEVDGGASNNLIFRVSECYYYNCDNGIHLKSAGPLSEVSILNTNYYNAPGQIGINYVPTTGSDNFRFASMIIQANSYNNIGSFVSGFDFTRTDGRDANVFMVNNAGYGNKNPHSKMNVVNNASTTTITTAGTYYKANWITTSIFTCKWTMDNNKITYQPENINDVYAIITGNLSVNGNGRNVSVAIVKNGVSSTLHGETTFRIQTSNQPYQFSTVIYIPDMHKNDYLEMFVTSSVNGDMVTFLDVQWFTNSQ